MEDPSEIPTPSSTSDELVDFIGTLSLFDQIKYTIDGNQRIAKDLKELVDKLGKKIVSLGSTLLTQKEVIASRNEQISALKYELLSTKINTPPTVAQPSYRNALINQKQDYPINVYPIGEGCKSSEATKQLLKSSIDLSKNNIGIVKVKTIGKNGVQVLCRSKAEAENLSSIITEKNTVLQSSIPTKKYPVISFVVHENDFGEDIDEKHVDLTNDIITKNNIADVNHIKILHTKKTNKGGCIVILETHPTVFKQLTNTGHIFVSWSKCKFRERDAIAKCFKCHKFGHVFKHCNFSINDVPAVRCRNCGDTNCQAEKCLLPSKCINCCEYNQMAAKRNWQLVEVDHRSSDRNCPSFIKANNKARESIDYDG